MENSVVYVVDDDVSTRRSLGRLISAEGLSVEVYATADDFLESVDVAESSCLLLDVRMPGTNGLELQQRLLDLEIELPIIFMTGDAKVSESVVAMKGGAVDFLEKPIDCAKLLSAIHVSLEKNLAESASNRSLKDLKERLDRLTSREYEVFSMACSGFLNKQIAETLSISEKTVKVHRSRVMQKMDSPTFARLVCMAQELNIPYEEYIPEPSL